MWLGKLTVYSVDWVVKLKTNQAKFIDFKYGVLVGPEVWLLFLQLKDKLITQSSMLSRSSK